MSFLSKFLATGLLIQTALGYGDVCSTVTVDHGVEVTPVEINQTFDNNTVIIINGGVTIDITNAPVSISTVFNVTTTVTSTVTATPTPGTFAIAISTTVLKKRGLIKRQAPACNDSAVYLNSDGSVGPPGAATQYFIQDGQLSEASTGAIFSTDDSLQTAPFVPSDIVGTITQTFERADTDVLSWSNFVFPLGAARFFLDDATNIVNVVFSADDPEDATEVLLLAVDSFSNSTGCATSTSSSNATSTSTTLSTGTGSPGPVNATVAGTTDSAGPISTSTVERSITADPCTAPEQTCAGIRNSDSASIAQSFPPLSESAQSLADSVNAIEQESDASTLVANVESLAEQFNGLTNQLDQSSEFQAGCATDNIVLENDNVLDGLTSLINAFSAKAEQLGQYPSLTEDTTLGFAIDDLSFAFQAFVESAALTAVSRDCYITESSAPVEDELIRLNDLI